MKTKSKDVKEIQKPGRKPTYDWDSIFDGQTWVLEAGVDYPKSKDPRSIRSSVYSAANRRGIKVTTSILDGELHVQRI